LRGLLMSAARLLPSLRELCRRLSEAHHLERWELRHVLFSLGFSIGYTDGLAVEAARGLATIVGGMRNDHWAKRNRKRRAKKRAEEAAERRHEDLKEAWRRRREEGGPEEDSTGRNRKGRQE
jgi:hypothetical protein